MGRAYAASDALSAARTLREVFPMCGITADIIVGFPGESDADFAATMQLQERCAFSRTHVFPFSARPGTRAATLPEQLPASVKRERAAACRALASRMSRQFAEQNVGGVVEVLFETEKDGVSSGYAGNYLRVFARGGGLRNRVLPVSITRARGESALGDIL
jgi:threonylcarbamoyladenosine tRNA methylthiotransferase MtaB